MQETPIYALIDSELVKKYDISLFDICSFLNKHNIPIAQYRNKSGSDEEVAKALEYLRQNYNGKLIVNDRLTLVDLVDGVHLGQEDLLDIAPNPKEAIRKIRQKIGKKLLGISTHNLSEIEVANGLDIDYIGLGAYRSTSTKSDAKAKGEELLKIAKHSYHLVALIGGVTWEDNFDSYISYKVLGRSLFEKMIR